MPESYKPELPPRYLIAETLTQLNHSLVERALGTLELTGSQREYLTRRGLVLFTDGERVGSPPLPATVLGSDQVSLHFLAPIDDSARFARCLGVTLFTDGAPHMPEADKTAKRSDYIVYAFQNGPPFAINEYLLKQQSGISRWDSIGSLTNAAARQPRLQHFLTESDCVALVQAVAAAEPFVDSGRLMAAANDG